MLNCNVCNVCASVFRLKLDSQFVFLHALPGSLISNIYLVQYIWNVRNSFSSLHAYIYVLLDITLKSNVSMYMTSGTVH